MIANLYYDVKIARSQDAELCNSIHLHKFAYIKIKLAQFVFDQIGDQMMNIDSIKITDAVEEDLETNETNKNESKNENGEKDSDEDELDDDEFEVDRILNVAAMDGEVKYQVRWKGYGSDEDSWEPEWNLETARLILDKYIASHQDEVKKAQDIVLTRKKLRKRCGKQIKLQNKRNKLRRSSSSEYSETAKTMNIRDRRNDSDSGEDYEVFKKRKSRYRATRTKLGRTKIASLSTNKEDKPFSKDLSPKRAKNAWLYDDAEDADSDASEGSGGAKKKDVFLHKTKENSQLKENVATKKSSMSLTTAEEQCESNSDEKLIVLLNKKQKKKEEALPKVDVLEENYEPKVEFIGIVQCHDGAVKVIYTKKNETKAHIVSVREAFEIDGFGLVQYFISRCEFGEPQSSKV
uniref:Chromo domain-containing protein n=1 Tax=Loa loa TaxID=7209 RepID=A0A1I7VPD7_LOALO